MNPDTDQYTPNELADLPTLPITQLARNMRVGDLIFIRVAARPFRAVANATKTWTNHVGVVTHVDDDPCISESTFPISGTTTLSRFIARSDCGRVAVARLKTALTPQQIKNIQLAAHRRTGVFYDTGFNLHSRGQFCSRYAHEVLSEATGISVGKIETLRDVVSNHPNMKLGFWRLWYLGHIPWERKTITPVSLLQSTELDSVFYGNAIMNKCDEKSKEKNHEQHAAPHISISEAYASVFSFWKKCLLRLEESI